jgi:hypothetical protein
MPRRVLERREISTNARAASSSGIPAPLIENDRAKAAKIGALSPYLFVDNDRARSARIGALSPYLRSGKVWDNAVMESFFSTLKTERTAQAVCDTGRRPRRRLRFPGALLQSNPEALYSGLREPDRFRTCSSFAACPRNRGQLAYTPQVPRDSAGCGPEAGFGATSVPGCAGNSAARARAVIRGVRTHRGVGSSDER